MEQRQRNTTVRRNTMTYQECSKEELASLLEETKAAYEALKA